MFLLTQPTFPLSPAFLLLLLAVTMRASEWKASKCNCENSSSCFLLSKLLLGNESTSLSLSFLVSLVTEKKKVFYLCFLSNKQCLNVFCTPTTRCEHSTLEWTFSFSNCLKHIIEWFNTFALGKLNSTVQFYFAAKIFEFSLSSVSSFRPWRKLSAQCLWTIFEPTQFDSQMKNVWKYWQLWEILEFA